MSQQQAKLLLLAALSCAPRCYDPLCLVSFELPLGVFPVILTVLNRDVTRGIYNSSFRLLEKGVFPKLPALSRHDPSPKFQM